VRGAGGTWGQIAVWAFYALRSDGGRVLRSFAKGREARIRTAVVGRDRCRRSNRMGFNKNTSIQLT
jgi:hypothetical protein